MEIVSSTVKRCAGSLAELCPQRANTPQKLPTNMFSSARVIETTEGNRRGQLDVDDGDTLSGFTGSGKSPAGLRKLGRNEKNLLW